MDLEHSDTPNSYMERCLGVKTEKDSQFINDNFKDRHCFLFPTPLPRKKLRDIEKVLDINMDEDFVAESNRLVKFIKTAEPKKINGSEIKGDSIADLLSMYLSSINSKSIDIPKMESLIENVNNEKAYNFAIKKFNADLILQNIKDTLPLSNATLDIEFQKHWIVVENTFISKSIKGETYEEKMIKLKGKCKSYFDKVVREENYKVSTEKCKKFIQKLIAEIMGSQMNERYQEPEGQGLRNLESDLQTMKTQYEECEEELGPAKYEIYTSFENNEVKPIITVT